MADPRKTFVVLAGKDFVDVVACLRPSAGMKCADLIQELRRATFAIPDMVQSDFWGPGTSYMPTSRMPILGLVFERVSTQATSDARLKVASMLFYYCHCNGSLL